MQAMDVFLMPSLFEGLPVVGVEAQASGLPCVFSDVITKEVDIIGSSKFISLESSLDTWVNEILKFELYERKNSKETIVAKGYDIKQIAMDLQKFYLERTSKNE
jgi:glycosyltransferase involved in cell wall biosynthesis